MMLVSCLVESVMDRMWLVEGYPFSELRLVPKRFSEHVYGHLIAYSANPCHDQLKPAHKIWGEARLLSGKDYRGRPQRFLNL